MGEDAAISGAIPDAIVEGATANLRSYQARWLVDVAADRTARAPDDVAHRGARQVGKDRTWSFETATDMGYIPRQQWSILSASLSHSRDFLGDVSQHLDFLEALTRRAGYSFPRRIKDSADKIWLENGSKIEAYAATPKNAQGRRGNVILNEMGIMPRAKLVYETAEAVVRGQRSMGLPAKWRIIGNASVKGSFFHVFWESELSASFRKITTTWEEAFLSWLTEDLGHTTAKATAWVALQVASMIARLGVSGFGQWYRCLWRSPEEGFFDADLLTARQYDPAAPPKDFPDLDDKRVLQGVGWDPSRRKHPAGFAQSLVGKAGVRHYIHRPHRMTQTPWHIQEDNLERLISQRRTMRLVIDRQGIGDKPAEDAARRWGHAEEGGFVEPYAFTTPSRMALFNHLLSQFERSVCWIPANLDLRMELEGVQRVYNTHGVEGLRIPEEADNHGDMAVACALAEWGLGDQDGAMSLWAAREKGSMAKLFKNTRRRRR